ncbi:MAG: hypothetical protein NVSMB9_33330 [Isosphaeraceae bacterium]
MSKLPRLCSIVITILVIVQAHRVIKWARQMQAAGVPLTTKPDEIGRRGLTGDQR